MQWFKMDLHLHTPGSLDYADPHISYLDILHTAEARGLDIIAFTDHNSVGGYKAMMEEIEKLEFLVDLKRAEPEEEQRLTEYNRLLERILVLPGFEFTANFGFHVIGIFSPSTPINFIEHILLDLGVKQGALAKGDPISGSTTDVLEAYGAITRGGGICIAAHVNSNNGVMMLDKNWGGQTRIAYTQDTHLHSLEVTDLLKQGRRTTSRFFDGSKPEYPRRMHIIQGSDAHRLKAEDVRSNKNLGVGDRVTEVLLPEATFDALLDMFENNDFARTRPYRRSHDPYDHIQAARQEGPSIVQAFHEKMTRRNGHLYAVLTDICAMANTNGGTIYVGLSEDPKVEPAGIRSVAPQIEQLHSEVDNRITPKLDLEIDAQSTQGKTIIRILVPHGADPPYAIDENKFYVRDETEANLAVRDEIVQLILRNAGLPSAEQTEATEVSSDNSDGHIIPPKTGVEIVSTEKRQGKLYHTVRDLRNGNTVNNVTRQSARDLWRYAIIRHENETVSEQQLDWRDDIALVRKHKYRNYTRYDLAQKEDEGLRVYYGVTADGMSGKWQDFVEDED
ncbi:MAG: putative DNA binding domain-containing protein [Chloroflexi bacterium]|nr:putative DNA binding domain-containing protein [Chloroflexota bacterium]